MKQVSFFYFVLMIGIIIIGCKTSNNPIGDNSDILGCMEVSACNYDSKANISNDSCVFTKDCNGECGGMAELDVCGVCGGNIESEENCLECQYAIQSLGCDGECSQSPIILDECGVCGGSGIPDGDCDCDGTVDLGCGCGEDGPSGCDNECGSTLEYDACGVCDGYGSTCEGLWNVYYDVSVPIAGFQFEVNEGNIINASGGAATEAGLSVSNSPSTVLAFSFSGATIPPGTGTLISLEITGDSNSFCIKDLVLSDIDGGSIPAIIENCNSIKYSE